MALEELKTVVGEMKTVLGALKSALVLECSGGFSLLLVGSCVFCLVETGLFGWFLVGSGKFW